MMSTMHQGGTAPARRKKFSEMQAAKMGGRRGGLEPIEMGIQPAEAVGGATIQPTDYGRSFQGLGPTADEAASPLPTAGDAGPGITPEWANW